MPQLCCRLSMLLARAAQRSAARRTFMMAPRSLRCSFSFLPGRGSGMTLHAYCLPVSRCVTSLTLEKPAGGGEGCDS